MNLIIFAFAALLLMITSVCVRRCSSERKRLVAAVQAAHMDNRLSALENAQAELSAQVSCISRDFSKQCACTDQLADYEERLAKLSSSFYEHIKECRQSGTDALLPQIQHLANIQRIQDVCVSELGTSLDYLESTVCEYTSAVEDVLNRQYDDELHCFSRHRFQKKNSSGFSDGRELWLRLFDVRNHLSRVLLHYNEHLSLVDLDLKEEDVTACEELSEQICLLFEEKAFYAGWHEDWEEDDTVDSFEHECNLQTDEELPF